VIAFQSLDRKQQLQLQQQQQFQQQQREVALAIEVPSSSSSSSTLRSADNMITESAEQDSADSYRPAKPSKVPFFSFLGFSLCGSMMESFFLFLFYLYLWKTNGF
jgi:hypothetical protein